MKPSEYLIKTAVQHIEGDITIDQVKDMLDTYYQTKDVREQLDDERTGEADKVSARITEILSEQSFSFTPDYLLRIHRRLFEGIYKHAGQLRDVNITKKEWVLNGDTVLYSNYDMLRETLEYDFEQEKKTDYSVLNADMAVLGSEFALDRFFIASHTVALLPPLRVTIAKKTPITALFPNYSCVPLCLCA